MATITQPSASAWVDQAMQTMTAAMQTGIRLQSQAMRLWLEMLQEANAFQQLQRRAQGMMTGIAPDAQQHAGQYFTFFSQACQTGMDMMRRTMEPITNPAFIDAQHQIQNFWQESLGALNANARELAQHYFQMMDSWTQMANRGVAAGAQAAKAGAQAAGAQAESVANPEARMHARSAHARRGRKK